jgi:hypothetical protein
VREYRILVSEYPACGSGSSDLTRRDAGLLGGVAIAEGRLATKDVAGPLPRHSYPRMGFQRRKNELVSGYAFLRHSPTSPFLLANRLVHIVKSSRTPLRSVSASLVLPLCSRASARRNNSASQ